MSSYKTEQEAFWTGEFGNQYTERNQGERAIAASIAMFSRIFSCTNNINSIFEFGANRGINLMAIKSLLPEAELSALEINKKAIAELKLFNSLNIYEESIYDFNPDYQRDFVFTRGVLIHLNPERLEQAYQALYITSKRYICVAEYYNPTPVEVEYRGFSEKLFKRDFAGDLLDRYSDLKLLDYGFTYRRDNNFEFADITWFLLEKTQNR